MQPPRTQQAKRVELEQALCNKDSKCNIVTLNSVPFRRLSQLLRFKSTSRFTLQATNFGGSLQQLASRPTAFSEGPATSLLRRSRAVFLFFGNNAALSPRKATVHARYIRCSHAYSKGKGGPPSSSFLLPARPADCLAPANSAQSILLFISLQYNGNHKVPPGQI